MKLQLTLLRVRSFLLTALVLTLITTAALVGVARLAFPYVERFKPEVEQWLSTRVGGEVSIGSIEGEWTPTGPRLLLYDLVIGERNTALAFSEADVSVDLYSWMLPRSGGTTALRLHADEINLERQLDGSILISGLAAGGSGRNGSRALRDPDSWVLDAQLQGDVGTVRYHDLNTGGRLEWKDVQMRVHGDGRQLRARLFADQGDSGSAAMVAHVEPRDGRLDWTRLYLTAREINIQSWFPDTVGPWPEIISGTADLELWGDTAAGITGSLSASDLVLAARANVDTEAGPLEPRFAAESLATRFEWRRREGGWDLGIADFNVQQYDTAIDLGTITVSRHGAATEVRADDVRLQEVSSLAVVFGHLSPALRSQLYAFSPAGTLKDTAVYYDGDVGRSSLRFSSEFSNLTVLQSGGIPGISNLSGRVAHSAGVGNAQLRSEDTILSLPGTLRDPLYVEELDVTANWHRDDEGLHIDLSEFLVNSAPLHSEGRLKLLLEEEGSKPVVDLAASIERMDMARFSDLLPYASVRPGTLAFLDRAFLEGEGTSGAVALRGDLDDWPFHDNQGRFRAVVNLEGLGLEFSPQWPPVYGMDARVEFFNSQLNVQMYSGAAMGNRINDGLATIEELGAAPMLINLSAVGDGNDWIKFISQSPVGKKHARHLVGLSLDGQAEIDIELNLPFKPNVPIGVGGEIRFSDVDYADEKYALAVDALSGPITFTADGFRSDQLKGQFDEVPVDVGVAVGDSVQVEGASVTAFMEGNLRPAALIDSEVLNPWLNRLEGRANWTVNLVTRPQTGLFVGEDEQSATDVTLVSNLIGTHVRLPAPLGKPEDLPLPVSVTTSLPIERDGVTLRYGDILSLRYHPMPDGTPRGFLISGDGVPDFGQLPANGVRVEGSVGRFDIDAWDIALEELVPDDGSANSIFETVDVEVDEVILFGRRFGNVSIEGTTERRIWDLEVAGDGVDGELRLPFRLDRQNTVDAQFKRLEWPDPIDPDNTPEYQPADSPTLHFYAESMRFGEAELGTVRLETYPTNQGMRVARLDALSDAMSLQASGDWNGVLGADRSRFEITIAAENLGEMLAALGFNGMVDGGQTLLSINADWLGKPTDFGLSRLGGKLDIAVGHGQFLDLEPGAGRFFGLLSLQAIPRRLILDFADVFKSGLTFDSISGSFSLDSGQAFTDDLAIKGPSADIYVHGRTGLAEQDYDQRITVVPSVGETLPLVGALAGGGPAAAAALIVVQNVFGKQISEMTQLQYHVTGSWSDPEVEQVRTASREVSSG